MKASLSAAAGRIVLKRLTGFKAAPRGCVPCQAESALCATWLVVADVAQCAASAGLIVCGGLTVSVHAALGVLVAGLSDLSRSAVLADPLVGAQRQAASPFTTRGEVVEARARLSTDPCALIIKQRQAPPLRATNRVLSQPAQRRTLSVHAAQPCGALRGGVADLTL